MPRIIAIDYGKKRTGLAISDPLNMIANGVGTIDTEKLVWNLKQLFAEHEVDTILLGYPKNLDGTDTDITAKVDKFYQQLQKLFPDKKTILCDERFTSKMAFQAMIDSGLKKKDRQNKALIDEISAKIILQGYLDHQ
ncbi:Holliday junction resolvase RuvX [Edaphocola flava]|jgi:putative Holliday junction resolvase|uniref:Holliday junction resolvase RuvX n=1 Tax=Edaphocola flava TaxID=2499629 RepID=UPI000F915406|nr:Holliday junction resolvase RuvX [Edaphocola flava]